jgi:hypothetical protein
MCSPAMRGSLPPSFELVETPIVEHVFQACLLAVCAVAVVYEHAHDGVGDVDRFLRRHVDTRGAREILVPGDAAET